jgi:hypothetical protein
VARNSIRHEFPQVPKEMQYLKTVFAKIHNLAVRQRITDKAAAPARYGFH